MAVVISLKGINQAVASLNYQNEKALKYRLVHAISRLYEDENSLESVQGISAEELVKGLWDTGDDPTIIKAKRKNLSSIKSSVNADLKKLYKEGKNPEAITIGRNNIFVMADEAKDKLLEGLSVAEASTLDKIAQSLNVIKDVLSSPEAFDGAMSSDGSIKLEELRSTIENLAQKLGLGGKKGDLLVQASEGGQGPESLKDDAKLAEYTETSAEGIEDEGKREEIVKVLPEIVEEDEVVRDLEAEEAEPGETEELEELDQDLEYDDLDDIGQEEDYIQQARVLADDFQNYLGDTDRFYNQYLLIPPGIYILGSKEPNKNEEPERAVQLPRFYMGKFPVTNALFEIFVEKTGYRTTSERQGYSTVYQGRFRDTIDEKTGLARTTCHAAICCTTIHGACWYHPEGPDSTIHNKKNHPVVHVSVEDAMAFAAWTGKRLPTENEWEAAARDANGYVFSWGNDWKSGSCNIEESAIADTTPVDKYTEFAGGLGIIDAIGNVLEWTLDTCEPPPHVRNGSTFHVVKGGSWISGNDIRLSSRFKWNAETPSNILGFRCVAI